jgi:glycolate dehydrogenase iron-sulfur subunit
MQTALAEPIRSSAAGAEADAILRSCVHCGFCLPACPTYQLLGDELDSPRGRIYLLKQLLEGEPVSAPTQLHLDRCLGCRACESACPSGVRYGRLLDLGRPLAEARVTRSPLVAAKRYLLRRIVPHAGRARALLRAAAAARALLPASVRRQLPRLPPAAGAAALAWPVPRHARRVALLEGCVQPTLGAAISPAAARVLDRLGISALRVRGVGCCGAVAHHLGAEADTRGQLRRSIDALSGAVEAGVEAIIHTSSACTAMLGEYGRLLQDDPRYAPRAARVSALARDISAVLAGEGAALNAALQAAPPAAPTRVAFQAPCSLQHALKAPNVVEPLLRAAGYVLTPVNDGQRCCGSAGTYSILQPHLSQRLLESKVSALEAGAPQLIATANIGCLHHLRGATALPVRHWVELIEERLARG